MSDKKSGFRFMHISLFKGTWIYSIMGLNIILTLGTISNFYKVMHQKYLKYKIMNLKIFWWNIYCKVNTKESYTSKQKDKKIVFSEEIDSSINGIALGTAFVMLSIFVVYFKIFNTTI